MSKLLFMMYDMRCGGIEKALISMLHEIDYSKHSVTLLLLKKEGEYLEDLPKEVKVETLKIPDSVRGKLFINNRKRIKEKLKEKKYIGFLKTVLSILFVKILGQNYKNKSFFKYADNEINTYDESFDIAIDFQGLGSGVFNTFFIGKKVKSSKKFTWIHTDISKIKGRIIWIAEYYQYFNTIFSVSKKAESEFLKKFPDLKSKSEIFYNILPISSIKQLSNKEVDLPYIPHKIIILSVGRLAHEKGYDIAIKAVKKLVDEGLEFQYYIIGEGEYRLKLEKLIKKYQLEKTVILLGFCKNPYSYIKACDIYFQPSRFEGFSLTLGEAKILKKPILSTDFAGAREQIEDKKTGIIIDCTKDEMYFALKKLIINRTLRKELSTNIEKISNTELHGKEKLHQIL